MYASVEIAFAVRKYASNPTDLEADRKERRSLSSLESNRLPRNSVLTLF